MIEFIGPHWTERFIGQFIAGAEPDKTSSSDNIVFKYVSSCPTSPIAESQISSSMTSAEVGLTVVSVVLVVIVIVLIIVVYSLWKGKGKKVDEEANDVNSENEKKQDSQEP